MKAPSLFLLLSVSLVLAACSRPEPPAEPVRAVKLLTVGTEGLNARAELPGEVRARIESRLGFRVGGKLVQRPAQLGQRVAAGELLASLDPSDLALGSQAAQAAVAAAQTQRDLAAADLKRYQELQAQGFVSGAEIDRRQAALRAAGAGCLAALPGQRRELSETTANRDTRPHQDWQNHRTGHGDDRPVDAP